MRDRLIRITVLFSFFVGACATPTSKPAAASAIVHPESARERVPVLHDGESWLLANGVEHWVRVAGSARGTTPIVMVHGGPGGQHYAFERTIGPDIERFATVIYYEQRGCGRSKIPPNDDYGMLTLVADLEALRERLGLARMHLLGYSFGGALALEYAIAHPDRVDRLILQAPMFGNYTRVRALQMDAFEAISEGALNERIRSILRGPGSDAEHYEQIWAAVDTPTIDKLLFHDPLKGARMRQLWSESHLKSNKKMLRMHMMDQPGDPISWRARGLPTQTLVMVGLHDRNVGVDGPRELSRVLPRAKLVLFEHSAHFPDLEEPAKYAATVRRFLAEP